MYMLCDAFILQLHCFNVEKNLLQWSNSNQFLEVIMQMVIITNSKAVLVYE